MGMLMSYAVVQFGLPYGLLFHAEVLCLKKA
jgi:hypothetical protein